MNLEQVRFRLIPLLVLLPILLLPCLAGPGLASSDGMKGPRAKKPATTSREIGETSAVKIVLLGAVTFFQKYLSPIDGPRCNFYPTCSHYGHQAIEKYGAFKGLMMTGDRLIRCNPSAGGHGEYLALPSGRLYDPVKRNAFAEE